MEQIFLINQISVFLIDIIGIFIALLVYLSDRKKKTNQFFFMMAIFLLFWVTLAYLGSVETDKGQSIIWYRFNFGVVFISIIATYFFTLNFPKPSKTLFLFSLSIVFICLVGLLFTIFTDLIIKDVKPTSFGMDIIFGKGEIVYLLITTLLAFLILGFFFKKYFYLTTEEKIKVQYLIIGLTIFVVMNFVFNVVFPSFFKTVQYQHIGDYAAIFFLGFTAYAIVKRELFNIKVVLTAVLVAVIAILLGLDIAVFTTDLLIRLYKGLVLIIFLYFGYLLIRSVLREIKMREQIARAYEVEKAARTEIEKLTEAKTQFIMATQHHLRTPLTQMIGYLDLVFGGTYGKVPKKLKEVLDKFQVSTKRLIRVVNELLDISQFQMGKEVVSLQPGIDIGPILKEVEEELYFELKARNLYFKIQKSGLVPKIKADSEKLKVALFNIIDNAIKYTRQGGITINLKATDSNLLIAVKDTGIGIEPEQAKKLFKAAFERGEEAEKVHGFGRGIGVYITGHIIKAHHGRVWAESEGKDKGSTFYIELPVG